MRRWIRRVPLADSARIISVLGGLYVALAASLAFRRVARGARPSDELIVFALIAGPGVLLLYGGYHLPRTDIHADLHPSVAGWCLGGIAAMIGLLGFYQLQPGGGITHPVQNGLILTALSSVAGFGVGIHDARAKTRALEVEQRNRELRRYETLIEESTDVNAVLDTDGTFQYVPPSVERVLGYAPAELEGENVFEYVHPDDVDDANRAFSATVEGDRSDPVEFRFEHEDGSWVVLEGRGRNLLDDPTIDGVVVYTHDVTERKEYERDLEQYKTVAETASDVIVTIDEGSRIQAVNPAVEDVFGYQPDELVGSSLTTLMPDPLRERHRDALQRYLDTGKRTRDWDYVELPGLHRDGHDVPLAISFSEFGHDGERYFTGIIRDNTERKALEDELRQERDLRDRIFETSPIGILVVEDDRTISFVNEYAADLLGVPEAGVADLESLLAAVDVTTPEGTSAEGVLHQQVLSTGEPVHDEERRITRPDGEQGWLAINGAPLRDQAGEVTAVVFTLEDITVRKHYRDRLVSLNELSQDLTDAETEQAVGELAVETASDVLPLPLIAIALYDGERGRLEYTARTDAVTDRIGDGPLFESDRDLPWQVFSDQSEAVYDDLRTRADLSEAETPLRSAIVLPLGEYGVFIAGATSANAFADLDVSIAQMLAANTQSALDRVDRERTVRDQRDTLAARTEVLERVQRINSTIRGITTDLIQASTRDEIVQAVCDRLAAVEAYRFAWIGSHDAVTEEVTPEAWAGAGDDYVETIGGGNDGGDGGLGPTGEAVRTRQPKVRNNLGAEPPFEPWQQAALDRDYRACIAVPLTFQDTLYGVLTVYADQPDVFNDTEEAVLSELGESIGYALNALERRRALISDRSVELEFALQKGDPPLFRLAAELSCAFSFENIVQRADGPPSVFFTVRGTPPEEVRTFGERSPDIESLTLVSDRGEEALFEARLRDSAFFSALLDRGAMPQRLTATGKEGQAVIRVPRTSDIRTFVELFEARYEVAELVGRREVDEPIKTQQEFEAEFESILTERQEEILKTAYASGFFDSPREMSAQELAEMLGVSQPTVSRHIRAGERKLFGLVFDDD